MPTLQSATQFVQQRQTSIRMVVVVLLALYLLAFMAELTWRVIPAPNGGQTNTVAEPISSNVTSSSRINVNRIKQLDLFGRFNPEVQTQPQETITDAPETSLSLVLTGVVASTEADAGAAIIEHRNAQQTYGIGDKIDGTNATLREVFSDRVIIRNGPRNETLMLDGIDYDEANKHKSQVAARPATSSARSSTPRPALSDDAVAATQQLRSQPTKFTDFLSISPAQANGELLGYRVQPGKNPALFEAAGLTAGDVITEINGLDVTDPQQAREAMGELQTAESLQLTVLREEQYLTLYLDLPEPSDEE
ncbi:type II secretion system protein GspC [Alteromonas flava]|uniref:type II secretion system protein GspC n=1 Tax=Alteromonas flava TaxID=2048003 RepID=UPI001F0C4870|nr:type II secretion system protein GspC [Alteromonas flava]